MASPAPALSSLPPPSLSPPPQHSPSPTAQQSASPVVNPQAGRPAIRSQLRPAGPAQPKRAFLFIGSLRDTFKTEVKNAIEVLSIKASVGKIYSYLKDKDSFRKLLREANVENSKPILYESIRTVLNSHRKSIKRRRPRGED
jgi:hypothetical protein